jgi:hypothetical protein
MILEDFGLECDIENGKIAIENFKTTPMILY